MKFFMKNNKQTNKDIKIVFNRVNIREYIMLKIREETGKNKNKKLFSPLKHKILY